MILPRLFCCSSAPALTACDTVPSGELNTVDVAQGSSQNISSLTAVIQRNPNDPEAYNVRGSAYGKGGRYREALNDFDKAIELRPNFIRPIPTAPSFSVSWATRGRASDYNRAIQLNPNYDAAYIGRGNLYRKAGRTQDAFNDFQKAIQLDTTDPRAYHNRGPDLSEPGPARFAIEDFSTAISLAPDSAEPYNGRGLSYLATGDETTPLPTSIRRSSLTAARRRLGEPGACL